MSRRTLTADEKCFFQHVLGEVEFPRFSDEKLRKTLDRVVYHDHSRGACWNPLVITAMRRGFAAITLGTHVYFNAGQFPAPGERLPLQCHELVHVCQVASFGWGTALWLVLYFCAWLRFPYPLIPFERQAFEVEEMLKKRLESKPERKC